MHVDVLRIFCEGCGECSAQVPFDVMTIDGINVRTHLCWVCDYNVRELEARQAQDISRQETEYVGLAFIGDEDERGR